MAGLIPVGGGGEESKLTCFRCGEPALGPCAICHVMICSDDDCAKVVREPGLPTTVLCTDCAKLKPLLSSSRFTAPVLLLLGLILFIAMVAWGDRSIAAGIGYIVAAALAILAGSITVSRWQWRSRLRKARGGGE